ncbi:hypothetical protein E0Z10_g2956 [Xylaria hypoxylon]|uniref:Uncharacterized protein n=1 Tax=Xylaria hypoxylon TaxID=37992 RepID=A0A4Z0Z2M3_9PEZI|nr:hypothetical protein E0Z10_g2956 [Xylaria hypoxylon]
MRLEIGYKWMHYVLFNFASCSSMFDKLSALPLDAVAEIRHVRVCDIPHEKSLILLDQPVFTVLKQLPCLQLDRLTVLGGDDARGAYRTIEYLVVDGSGWKELHYISKNSAVLSESIRPSTDHTLLRLQPSRWQQKLEDRDGALAKPLVTIYKSTKPGSVGLVVHPETRHILEQSTTEDHHPNDDEHDRDEEHERHDELDKEIHIVVKRGTGVFYKQRMVYQRDKPFPLEDMPARFEVQRKDDIYTHPYEYDWSYCPSSRYSRLFLEGITFPTHVYAQPSADTNFLITTPESNG